MYGDTSGENLELPVKQIFDLERSGILEPISFTGRGR